jgi:uncharacterized RmlC-like cupin family protein
MLALLPLVLAGQTAAPATGSTGTIVAVDNAHVRILSALDRPHQPTALHKHAFNRVMIYLDSGDQDISHPGAATEHHHWKAGETAWSPGGPEHISENVGSADLRIVEIEIKQPGPAAPPKRTPKLDPIAIDPAHNKLIFENDQVRVFRSTREIGGHEKWHEHVGAGRAAVLLSPLAARVETASGATPMSGAPGDAFWTDGYIKHRAYNIGTTAADMIVIEVK